ncbi:helix-turn-helix domain-containing protein [Mycobacterium sp. 21AC1]|uniref:ArsR/SmtB family transcription factor n=1 Tax=[Mycobacterium] appelbergii TaxID=2939269 RepID=UPI002938FF67|nr:SRPBCC domain-containing protein [Mycobacterium sp. 21AC1]MDV3126384.1 helix-turn-helix domain-containing protein [Mycobacterium sp. 21AC1]
MDEIFKALADPSRRQLLDSLNDHDGQTLRELCDGLTMARQSVSKHLSVLESAELVTTVWRGREKLHYLCTRPINAITDRWIDRYDRPQVLTLADVTDLGEEFVYTTYIRSTPERVWYAITNPGYSAAYLGHAIESDWLRGSTYIWVENGLRIEEPEQVILESDPYQRLAFTFRAFGTDETVAVAAAERRSQVSFDIEPNEDQVKLTVTHCGLGADSAVRQAVSDDWSLKLSNLKYGLEQRTP